MDIAKIPVGENPPFDVNVIIEVPFGVPVKYELDKESGALFVDRFIATPMFYPANYGFVPHSLSLDGDPVDAMVIGSYALQPGCVIRARPIGVLIMEDESGMDEKIIAVPHTKMTPYYADIQEIDDLPEILRNQIQHFFEHYKDLEKGKWVKLSGWGKSDAAGRIVTEAIDLFNTKK